MKNDIQKFDQKRFELLFNERSDAILKTNKVLRHLDKVNSGILELREKEDRRSFEPSPQFPVHGELVV